MRISDWSSDVCSSDLVDDDDFEAADREGFYRLGAFPGTAQRMERFETQGVKLCEEAVRALGENEDVQSATHLLLVSCTGFVAPGIDQMLIDRDRKSTRLNSSH